MLKYHIIVFGCQFNKAEGEKISQLFSQNSYQKTDNASKADLIVILACAVRQKAVDKIKNKVLALKHQNKKAKIVLSGCVLQSDKKWFEQQGVIFKKFQNLRSFLSPTGLVIIGEGCNNFCTYCVVPYTRGREKYRSQKAVINEVKKLLKKGVKEITLVAQNVNSYPHFPALLQKINKIPGDFRVRFLTNHPKDVSDELIKTMAQCQKIEKYLHLPFQAGDNAILKKMNRHYTRQQYLKLVSKIKKAIPDIKLSTDIIVGFPGETKKQFEKTVEVVKKVGFSQIFVAKYSPRQGTAAYYLKDNVPEQEKKRREKELRKIMAK
jgi:tRNA-2-methylthio-N6-dimethylallyladenosine synthase